MKKLSTLMLIVFTPLWLFIGIGCKEEIVLVAETTEEVKEISEIIPITPAEVYEIIIEKKDYFILDVRNPGEYAAGHLEGAALIPVSELEERLRELPEDKAIIVYCLSGLRSAMLQISSKIMDLTRFTIWEGF